MFGYGQEYLSNYWSQKQKWDISINSTEIKRIIREYYEQLYTKKLDNLDKMEKFLETQNLPKRNYKEIKNLN